MIIPIHIVYKSFGFGDTVNCLINMFLHWLNLKFSFEKMPIFISMSYSFLAQNSLWHAISDKKFNKNINDCVHEYVNI